MNVIASFEIFRLIYCGVGGQNSGSTSKSKAKDDDSPKSDTGASATAMPMSHSTTPPPVAYSSQSSNSSHGSGDGCEQNGKKKPERRLSSISDELVLNFPPSVDSYSRVASTGVDIRDRCRELLVKALMKGFDNGKLAYVIIRFMLSFESNSGCLVECVAILNLQSLIVHF